MSVAKNILEFIPCVFRSKRRSHDACGQAEHLDVTFRGRADHASSQLHNYRVFVNPSESEVRSQGQGPEGGETQAP